MELLFDPQAWASFLTLSFLEIVLGIDNLLFIAIAVEKLPEEHRDKARRIGLLGALGLRVALLFALTWVIGLTAPIVTMFGFALSWRDVILGAGGLFLLWKGTTEIHEEMEPDTEDEGAMRKPASLVGIVTQIMILDLVFSLDSVITAVGMTDEIPIMVAAVSVAILIMLFASAPVAGFIQRHPTTKMLALSFLLLVGVALVADGLHFHIPRAYLYFAIAFSMMVEALNLIAARRRKRKRAESKGKDTR